MILICSAVMLLVHSAIYNQYKVFNYRTGNLARARRACRKDVPAIDTRCSLRLPTSGQQPYSSNVHYRHKIRCKLIYFDENELL